MTKEQFEVSLENIYDWLSRTHAADLDSCTEFLESLKKEFYGAYLDGKKFYVSYLQFESFMDKYLNLCKKLKDHLKAECVFNLFSDLKSTFEEDRKIYVLNNYLPFISDASEEEKNLAIKIIPSVEDKESIRILNYKGLKLYECDGLAYTADNEAVFTLEWDWWYPIDVYIYLEKGWEKVRGWENDL